MAKIPITRRQWHDIMGQLPRSLAQLPGEDDLPAERVTWDEGRRFCARLSEQLIREGVAADGVKIDLPSEAQWEYACRAGTTSRWFFGDDSELLEEHAWYSANSGGHVHPVGTRRPNQWAIHDLYGNVAEWCLDEFRRYDLTEVIDPLVFNEQGLMKIVRGGHFGTPAEECRSASRAFCDRGNAYREPIGVRPIVKKSK